MLQYMAAVNGESRHLQVIVSKLYAHAQHVYHLNFELRTLD